MHSNLLKSSPSTSTSSNLLTFLGLLASKDRTEEDDEEDDREIDSHEEEDGLGNFGIDATIVASEVRAMEPA
ncbi:hypothetical protein E5676_scaffold522G00270 [Cucumis melo var. makuwa]|uniref:Uncharacterized protein n=1 Tax=Cucumis melo var. makuwa TaxID=1194695 RepID=A0A5D3D6C5_CUCMM|nr:hypothetical protein E5676_scaffold522G00270 [Cucumis melo var. makuwa]